METILKIIKSNDNILIKKIIDNDCVYDYHNIFIELTQNNNIDMIKYLTRKEFYFPHKCLEICIEKRYHDLFDFFVVNHINNRISISIAKKSDRKNHLFYFKIIKYFHKYDNFVVYNDFKRKYLLYTDLDISDNDETYWEMIGNIYKERSNFNKYDMKFFKSNQLLSLLGRAIKYESYDLIYKIINAIDKKDIKLYYADYIKPIKSAIIIEDINMIEMMINEFGYDVKNIREIKKYAYNNKKIAQICLSDSELELVKLFDKFSQTSKISKRLLALHENCGLFEHLFVKYVLHGNCPYTFFSKYYDDDDKIINSICIFGNLKVLQSYIDDNTDNVIMTKILKNAIYYENIEIINFIVDYIENIRDNKNTMHIISEAIIDFVLSDMNTSRKILKYIDKLINKYGIKKYLEKNSARKYDELLGKGMIRLYT